MAPQHDNGRVGGREPGEKPSYFYNPSLLVDPKQPQAKIVLVRT